MCTDEIVCGGPKSVGRSSRSLPTLFSLPLHPFCFPPCQLSLHPLSFRVSPSSASLFKFLLPYPLFASLPLPSLSLSLSGTSPIHPQFHSLAYSSPPSPHPLPMVISHEVSVYLPVFLPRSLSALSLSTPPLPPTPNVTYNSFPRSVDLFPCLSRLFPSTLQPSSLPPPPTPVTYCSFPRSVGLVPCLSRLALSPLSPSPSSPAPSSPATGLCPPGVWEPRSPS